MRFFVDLDSRVQKYSFRITKSRKESTVTWIPLAREFEQARNHFKLATTSDRYGEELVVISTFTIKEKMHLWVYRGEFRMVIVQD